MKHLKLYEEFGSGAEKLYKFTLSQQADKKQIQNWEGVFEVIKKADPSAEMIRTKDGKILLNHDLGWEASMNNEFGFETFFKSSKEKSEVESIIVSAYKNMGVNISTSRTIYEYSLKEVDEKSLPS